jgi:hypothetical protein
MLPGNDGVFRRKQLLAWGLLKVRGVPSSPLPAFMVMARVGRPLRLRQGEGARSSTWIHTV